MNQESTKKIKELFAKVEEEVAKSPKVEKLGMGTKIYVDDDGIVHLDPKGDIGSMMEYSEIILDHIKNYTDETTGSPRIRVLAKIPPIFSKMPPVAVRRTIKESLKRFSKNFNVS